MFGNLKNLITLILTLGLAWTSLGNAQDPNLFEAFVIEGVEATASSEYNKYTVAGNIVDGSGLNTEDLHGTAPADGWLSDELDAGPVWIQCDFDRPYRLAEMWVWNSNTVIESIQGYGLKDVTIETSLDGATWTALKDVELTQATGAEPAVPEAIALDGVGAKFVRIDPNSNWGNTNVYGLSELRFFAIPARARDPQPSVGTTDVPFDATLTWTAGVGAEAHEVYVSADKNAVANGTALVGVVTDSSFNIESLNLDLETTYYWKVNEVNNTQIPNVLEGDIWEFTTRAYFVVDNFESYADGSIADTWLDAWEAINGILGGSGIEPVADGMVVHSGAGSMLLDYDNSKSPFFTEVVRTISGRTNWMEDGITRMVVFFHGDVDNDPVERMYVKLNGKKIDCPADLTTPWWQQWTIPIDGSLGINRYNVHQLRIGIGDVKDPRSKKGKVYIDDVRLYRLTPSSNNLLNAIGALNVAGDLAGQLDTLIMAVMAADPAIVTALSSEEVYTAFLPTDDAFAALGLNADNLQDYLNEAALTDLLLYHLASGSLSVDDVLAAEQIEMTDGNLLLQDSGVLTDTTGRTAVIVASETSATNGMIHVVDSVLAPFELRTLADLMTVLNQGGDLAGQFDAILADPTVLETLNDRDAQYTVLVPTVEAMATLWMEADTDFLLYHITSGRLLAEDLMAIDQLTMLNGQIVKQADGRLIDTAGRAGSLTVTDIQAANGVIHIIDVTLLPAGPLVNLSFELPGQDKLKDFDQVPGWSIDPNAIDTGIETGHATDGEYSAILRSSDPAIWQLSNLTISEGDVVEVKLDAGNRWGTGVLQIVLYYEADGARVPAATSQLTLTDDMVECSLFLVAADVPDVVGKNIGVELSNVSEELSWLGVDYVRLAVSQ